jgi:hypothetical protein
MNDRPLFVRFLFRVCVVLLIAFGIAPQSAFACVNVTTAGPGTRPYDATATTAVYNGFRVSFTDVCPGVPGTRSVSVWFVDDVDTATPTVIGNVPFRIQSNNGIRYSFGPGEIVSQTLDRTFSGSDFVNFNFWLSPGRDAMAATRQIHMYWRTTDTAGAPIEGEQLVTIGLSIVPVFSLTLSAGGTGGLLDFGSLHGGAQLTTNVDIRSSNAFSIRATSQYSGVMRRVTTCGETLAQTGDSAEMVGYSATLNGIPISITTAFIDTRGDGASVRSLNNVPFAVRVDPALDSSTKRAGTYCDVITLRIEPFN